MTGKEVIEYIYENNLMEKQVILPTDKEVIEDYLTSTQLAMKLGVKQGTIRAWVARGKLTTGILVGRERFFPKDTGMPKRRKQK